MTNSAFGVEHGEVSKALPRPTMPKMTNVKTGASRVLKPLGASAGRQSVRAGRALNRAGQQQAAAGNTRRAAAASMGREGMTRAGAFMRQNPTATGAAIAGGGVLGVGGAGYAMGNRSNKQQRLAQYR